MWRDIVQDSKKEVMGRQEKTLREVEGWKTNEIMEDL